MSKKINNKFSGEMAELLFAAECYKHSLTISFPHTDGICYDFIVDNGKNLYRIQVKSSRHANKGGLTQFETHLNRKKSHKIDFYALYCFINSQFYIVPAKAVTSDTIYASKRLQVYKNSWQLLKR